MDKYQTSLVVAFIIVIIIVILVYLYFIRYENLTQIRSNIHDDYHYVIDDYPQSSKASDILSQLHCINKRLIKYMESKYQDTDLEDDVLFLKTNYSKENRYENVPGDIKNTSYTINKGTETKLCLRDLKTLELHDFETLLFVNFHELSHLFDYNIGHHPSFWRKFAIVLQNAKEMDLYTPVNYKNYPEKYCGIIIDYNPYYTYIVS